MKKILTVVMGSMPALPFGVCGDKEEGSNSDAVSMKLLINQTRLTERRGE